MAPRQDITQPSNSLPFYISLNPILTIKRTKKDLIFLSPLHQQVSSHPTLKQDEPPNWFNQPHKLSYFSTTWNNFYLQI